MKLFHKENLKNWIMAALSLFIALIVFARLPENIPTHFNASGAVDNYGSRLTIFMFPAIMITFVIGAEIFRFIDPKRENYNKFNKFYYVFFFLIDLLFLVTQLVIIAYSLGYDNFNTSTVITCLMGLLFAFIGNMLPKLKPNYYMGIKTPWALEDSNNWNKTHRLAGKVWMIGGVLMAVGALFLPEGCAMYFLLGIITIMCIIPVAGSYLYFVKAKE